MLRTNVTDILADYPPAIEAFEGRFRDFNPSGSWSALRLRAQILDDLAAGRVPDAGPDAIRYLNQVVDTVSETRSADIYELPDYARSDSQRDAVARGDILGGLQAESILTGYLSGHPFSVLKKDVSHLLNQLTAERYAATPLAERSTFSFDDTTTHTEAERALHAALEDGRVSQERRTSGATIERGSISEALFHRRHHSGTGWLFLPTGQEPYACCTVHPDLRDMAFYAEGDYHVIHCDTDAIFADELTQSIRFYMGPSARVEPGEMLEISPLILDRVPDVRAELMRIDSALTGMAPSA